MSYRILKFEISELKLAQYDSEEFSMQSATALRTYRDGNFHLGNSSAGGSADMAFTLGVDVDVPIAGDRDGLP